MNKSKWTQPSPMKLAVKSLHSQWSSSSQSSWPSSKHLLCQVLKTCNIFKYKIKWSKTMNIWVVIHPMMMLPSNLCFTYFSQTVSFLWGICIHCKMVTILHSSYICPPLQYDFTAPPIKRWILFPHSLNWLCDLLWSIEWSGTDIVSSKARL